MNGRPFNPFPIVNFDIFEQPQIIEGDISTTLGGIVKFVSALHFQKANPPIDLSCFGNCMDFKEKQ